LGDIEHGGGNEDSFGGGMCQWIVLARIFENCCALREEEERPFNWCIMFSFRLLNQFNSIEMQLAKMFKKICENC